MAEAPKVLVIVDMDSGDVRVYSNQPNLMVEVEQLTFEAPDSDRDLELMQREYPYLQFGEAPEDDDN